MNKKDNIFSVLDENPDLKKVAFFIFYLIFFIVMILMLRGTNKALPKENTRYNTGYNNSYTLESINTRNYHFNIIENINGNETIYDGDKNGNKMSLIKSGNKSENYYIENNDYYLRDENTLRYNKIDGQLEFIKFINEQALKEIITRSSYESFEEYFDSKKNSYKYEISTTTLTKTIDGRNIDLSDLPNKIEVTVKENKIEEIDLDLTNYYKFNDSNINKYTLKIVYSKYNEIDEIKVNK